MRFKIQLISTNLKGSLLPINYQYPLSAAIYKILQKGDAEYANFLHEKGYGKGFKFFTFSDLRLKFKLQGDRMLLLEPSVTLDVCFHLPEASRTFVEGLFRSEEIVIADKKSKVQFTVQTVLSEEPILKDHALNELVPIVTKPLSPIVAGIKKENGKYTFLAPDDERFINAVLTSWKNKIAAAYDEATADEAILLVEVEPFNKPWRSRLVTIKGGTEEETKIRGYLNFKLKLTAERRFLDLVLNAGMGLYSAQGMGCLGVVGDGVMG